jgi:hypothetical protein
MLALYILGGLIVAFGLWCWFTAYASAPEPVVQVVEHDEHESNSVG